MTRISSYAFESNRILLAAILVISVIMFFYSKKAGFETDMYSINFMSDKLKLAEKHLNKINDVSLKSVYVVSYGKSLEQALLANNRVMEKLETLKMRGTVKRFTNVGSILISDSVQRERIRKWREYWPEDKIRELRQSVVQRVQNMVSVLKLSIRFSIFWNPGYNLYPLKGSNHCRI